ncbi:hypothetical protein Pint_20487 [Pistacia integerrima]|uniref:Uncharacterized protein n=1 Tax=Pistacia integerrima TaxID=434235 RepID=A0ACC0X9Q5_9ROSI|nr:hypothetical protein Pint_20487 [Pistacia integerrima]
MPDLQRGIRRSKRLNKSQENNVCVAQTPQLGAGRGRGSRAMNQDNAKRFASGVHGRGGTGLDLPAKQVVEKEAEKLLAVEEEGSMSPLPEKVVTFDGGYVVNTCNPSNNSLAFINAIEVVSVPDQLITDDAILISPQEKFQGLMWQALETVYRVNMGGPTVTPLNDNPWADLGS